MNHNKEAKGLTFWRGSEVSQVKVLAAYILDKGFQVQSAVKGS